VGAGRAQAARGAAHTRATAEAPAWSQPRSDGVPRTAKYQAALESASATTLRAGE